MDKDWSTDYIYFYLFIFLKESSYREAIEILHEAVKKADINEVIDILKRMNNEEVHSSIFLRSSNCFFQKNIFFFYRKCNMNVFGRMSLHFFQMEAEILADDVSQYCHIQLENRPQINRKLWLKMWGKL
jgi:hypothetical protein